MFLRIPSSHSVPLPSVSLQRLPLHLLTLRCRNTLVTLVTLFFPQKLFPIPLLYMHGDSEFLATHNLLNRSLEDTELIVGLISIICNILKMLLPFKLHLQQQNNLHWCFSVLALLIILCGGDSPVHCRNFSRISGLYPLDANSLPLVMTNQISSHTEKCPW